jgi:uncharacterized protein
MSGKFEIYNDRAGNFRYRLKAANGQTILVSEGYKTRKSAESSISSVIRNAPFDDRYERKSTGSGIHIFNLKASNGQVIGTSESYRTAKARENGIASVKKYAVSGAISDLSLTGVSPITRRVLNQIAEEREDVLRRLVDR